MSRRLFRATVGALLFIPTAVGCDGSGSAPREFRAVGEARGVARNTPPQADAGPAPGGKPDAAAEPPIERKIVFNGRLEVVVKDFDAARAEVAKIVAGSKGYFAKSEVVGDAGTKRSGTFTIKVPAEKFQATVDAMAVLGVAVKNSTDSQDVTEEFVDVAARVKNLKAEEETLNRLLKDAAGRLDDVFKIREQIRKTREDIERAEGRMKALSALSALSTIVLSLREEVNYVPPTVEAAPTFSARVSGTFGESLGLLQQLGEWIVLTATAAAPWLPIGVVLVLGLRWLARRLPAPTARIAIVPPAKPKNPNLQYPSAGDAAPPAAGGESR